ncbi:hypothetical protein B0T22DRAFT_515436 [Podospora appendiculata]|uniref:Uncharacterized protein n=1 Tax=Podospora appendiculata TaxID=314037 RepID=A0AAE0XCT5_9PEZI|nr:hypothetical protein B0T22DRAFT_515436 [Podospora appendiculata]
MAFVSDRNQPPLGHHLSTQHEQHPCNFDNHNHGSSIAELGISNETLQLEESLAKHCFESESRDSFPSVESVMWDWTDFHELPQIDLDPKPQAQRGPRGILAVKSLAQAGKEEAGKRLLACPIYKHSPYQYRNCKLFRLRRMKDVKQHVYRRHMKPQLCDPYRGNSNSPPSPDSIFISETQKKALGLQYSSRNKPIEEQWHAMWNIIFPGKRRPRSIYLDSQLEGTVPIMRSLWEEKRSENIKMILDKVPSDACSLSADSLGQIMDVVFARFMEIEESGTSEEHDTTTGTVKQETVETPEPDEPGKSGPGHGSSDCATDGSDSSSRDTPIRNHIKYHKIHRN